MAALKTVDSITIEAVHEAGHAVVARLLAQPVKRTALAGVTTRYRRGDTKAHRQQAIIALAGPCAEEQPPWRKRTAPRTNCPIVGKVDARDVRFAPESGHLATRLACPLCAKSGLMHCSKTGIFTRLPRRRGRAASAGFRGRVPWQSSD